MKNVKKYRTDFLFSRPTFLIGIGSIANLAGNYFEFNESSSSEKADNKALISDWGMVGTDINKSVSKFKEELCINSK